jgi:hypothetical protein
MRARPAAWRARVLIKRRLQLISVFDGRRGVLREPDS